MSFRNPDAWMQSSGDSFDFAHEGRSAVTSEKLRAQNSEFQSGDGQWRTTNRSAIHNPAGWEGGYYGSGDGVGTIPIEDVGRDEHIQLAVRPSQASSPATGLLTKPTPTTESWKLACLVFVFVIWVSTASALLFMYMERYLLG